jgi:hypothetical protein
MAVHRWGAAGTPGYTGHAGRASYPRHPPALAARRQSNPELTYRANRVVFTGLVATCAMPGGNKVCLIGK